MYRRIVLAAALLLAGCAASKPACVLRDRWAEPAALRLTPDPTADAANPIVLLGEEHDNDADHAWQLAVIQRVYSANPATVLGFEMFPRAAQSVLDQWTQGRLTEADFLARSDWAEFWGFPPELYMPIFRFARDHHIPMRALNISHHLVHLVGQNGWQAVPERLREGVGTPAAPSAAYRQELAEVMSGHGGPPMTPDRLAHFVDAQLLWDRAMAEAIAAQRARAPQSPVVALMGAGHLENRQGVPNQLAALGLAPALVLIPVAEACHPLGPAYADAIYVAGDKPTLPPAPRS